MRPEQMLPVEKEALERLLAIASGYTDQSRRVADFLLAWWNPASCGSYDITSGWGLDEDITEDVCTVFRLATRANSYPDTLGYESQFESVVRAWRPELVGNNEAV
ncbi:hypothetical protein LA345_41305 (plasmid) [Burkholderia vietnamiensis]|uniref:DUF7673 domain-containing protein n=1 Tax=Burkholderia vietnamiensis (strain G4 / LMG 22486) TaxID=269482 RepID=A4JTK1_BURVG|nr:conserved hypothetical protein [Burkholderia vietnamiensis G4]MCB4350237.1 hypothetical protein [Burkholderia vietnamiensis]